jgi:polysaccharide export outer membrane protein
VIGPLDKISVKVFKVPDLSQDNVLVDANGQITMPLIGDVTAAGKTSQQLADVIASELGAQYLQNPQVSVAIVDSASRKVTVEGEVKTPGVYAMKGRMTLMQTIAMAGGFSEDADFKKVAVIRTVDGVRKVAICNYNDIRLTRTPDPEISGDDVIVVDGSHGKMAWSAVLKTLPLFSLLAIAL